MDAIGDTIGIVAFVAVGAFLVFFSLVIGKIVRPRLPNPEKREVYECGEPTIGSSWVQFDLRFYVMALVYIVFDVEIVLLIPWAMKLKEFGWAAFLDLAFFFGVLMVGFLYLWRFGFLDWVRSAASTTRPQVESEEVELRERARQLRPSQMAEQDHATV